MGLKYNASGRTYDLGGPQYTNVGGGSKRLNYIASGKTYQLGLATDSTCSQYSPLVMRINGTNHYIGRSTSGSYITSDSILTTHAIAYDSTVYSVQSDTYTANIYTIICSLTELEVSMMHDYGDSWSRTESYTSTGLEYRQSTSVSESSYGVDYQGYVVVTSYYSTVNYSNAGGGRQTLTSTNNVSYLTTTSYYGHSYNITVSTAKSASSSSHNFV